MALTDPVHPADAEARALAQGLLHAARHAALAYTDPASGTPGISRIAFGLAADGMVTLISSLSAHHAGLAAAPACAVMLGDPGPKGDPLTHPRLMIQASATFVARSDPRHDALARDWLHTHPKAKLYIGFADFGFVLLAPQTVFLNAGFGKAYRLSPTDLAP